MITLYITAITVFIVPNENPIQTVRGATIYVPTDYPTIQEAINNAKNGDTVYVYGGTYYENIVVNKSINLTGEDRDSTIIDGGGNGDAVHVTASWVNITGFTFTGSGWQSIDAGIELYNVQKCRVSNNNAMDNWGGIYLNSSIGNNITDNVMSENGIVIEGNLIEHWNTHNIDTSNTVNGKPVYYWKNQIGGIVPFGAGQVILANCTDVDITNQLLTNSSIGIELGFSSNSYISGNTVSSNKLHGIFLEYSNRNNITGNSISSNFYHGVYLVFSIMNDIISNRVSNNENGIYLYFSSDNNITSNDADNNQNDGLYLCHSHRNNISDNRILNSEHANGIYLVNSDENNIIGNTLSSNRWSAGIWLVHCDGNYIIGNNASNNFEGIRLQYSSSNTIENNTSNSNFMYGIWLKYSSNSNTVENNTCHSNGIFGVFIGLSDENNIVSNNISSTNNYDGIRIGDSCGNNVVGNIVLSNADSGIFLTYADGNKVTGNYVSSNDEYGIHLYYSIRNDIAHNNISSNRYGGVKLEHSIWNNVFDNNISNNEHGIVLTELSKSNTITHNNILSNSYKGIHIDSSSHNKITRNDILDNLEGVNVSSSLFYYLSNNNTISGNNLSNNDYGIRVSSSSYNTFTSNNVSSNILDGLRLLSSSNWNSIIGNTVFSNGNYGFYINGSSDNSIYHNNILDNINQAYDDTNNGNQWDNGYPSGGNYWSDFDEPSEGAYDDFNGPDQNVLSGDGIVDKGFGGGGGKNPYVIDLDSQDDYPLMGPYKNYMILKQGWNLISIPQIQQDQNLTKVLVSIDGLYDAVQWCDITDKNDPWKHYRPGKPYGNDLFKIKETMGFWIHIIPPGDTIFYYNGVKPAQNQKITLYPGWNMVGYPSLSNKIRTAALNNINFGSDVDSIWTHNAATQKWEEIGEFDYFELGRGYWVHAKTNCVWEVPL